MRPGDRARRSGPLLRKRLTIYVVRGVGSGRTDLSAFDTALGDAGVADFNLVRLSSVVPPGSRVVEIDGPHPKMGRHGDRLYCVYAAGYATRPGEVAFAGIAWALKKDGSAAGLFVEHTGSGQDELEALLSTSVEDLAANRGGDYEAAGAVIASAECTSAPVCALVIAPYACAGW